ncbi:HypE family hydrogenase expression/formation protein [Effusibacillus lacus]|uniref:Hydrogenase expression/formation protein HypE n=1 Tax=Effusibacillus lacus TaxID=1348429 RepID=A0A292YGJ2_9BACL|nr:AIR synthase-related protein [Effusibacillus lacus]TCS68411.1 hydrogenase expression/formation protein HypE [Effusibacillus lacus]GAX89667.1 hydrogenase expression/formation protein HypE [Effusibacillus lacus]
MCIKIICSGTIGDHGVAILLARGQLELEGDIESDSCSLLPMVTALKETAAEELVWMRDPTRGAIGTTLNELAEATGMAVVLEEERIPIWQEVHGACEILGIDPLYVANEGKLLAVVRPEAAVRAVETLRKLPGGESAAIIGEIATEPAAKVLMRTFMGGNRVIDLLVGDPLPRIC